jgi:4'-phosphopantetheinyl transferase
MMALDAPELVVDVWAASLCVGPAMRDRLENVLLDEERARAERFHFPRDRERFIAGRGILRTLLGRYTSQSPQAVEIDYLAYGKPVLRGEASLAFNVSHSGPHALYAFARGADVQLGIDLEEIRPRPKDDWQVAEHYFAVREVEELRRLPEDGRSAGFFTCWTRKEAFIKARGDGLQLPLRDFEVTLAPGKPPALLRTAWSPTEPKRWRLGDLSYLVPGCAAALAVDRRRVRLVAREWSEDTTNVNYQHERSTDNGTD